MFAVQQRDDLKYGGYDGPLSDYLLSLADAVILSAFGVIFCISGSIAFAVHSLKKNTITYTWIMYSQEIDFCIFVQQYLLLLQSPWNLR